MSEERRLNLSGFTSTTLMMRSQIRGVCVLDHRSVYAFDPCINGIVN